MRFSVVIPTYNRSKKLEDCLQALFHQDYEKSNYEILVIDDGSQDDTISRLTELQKKSPVPLMFFSQTNQGQGKARNKGIAQARGEIILLLGDDIIATQDLMKEHDRIHRAYEEENAAVLGFITWHPKLPITPLMLFMEQGGAIFGRFGGHQFAYDLLKGKSTADYRFFYTSNISLKRSLLLRYKFDQEFSGYGWEDIELGYRLFKKEGLVLHYAPRARAYHDHMMSEGQFTDRMRHIGEGSHRLAKKYPELRAVPSQKKQKLLHLLSCPSSLHFLKIFSTNFYFYALSKKYFLEGIERRYNEKRN